MTIALRLGLEICLAVAGVAVVAECPGDLLRQPVVQAVDQVADVIGDVAEVQVLSPSVARVEDLTQVGQDVDDLAIAGQRRVPEVVDGAAFLVGLDDPLGDRGERFGRFEVRGHRQSLVEPPARHHRECQTRRGLGKKTDSVAGFYLRSAGARESTRRLSAPCQIGDSSR